jgi:hypothetical protein
MTPERVRASADACGTVIDHTCDMRISERIKSLFQRQPLTGDQVRAVEEAGLAKDHLRNLKAASRSLDNPAGQQPGSAVGRSSKVQQAAEDAVATESPQQQEREDFGTEL